MASTPPPRGWLSDNVKWIAVTVIIPAVAWIVGYQQEQRERIRAANDKEIEMARQAGEAVLADARNDVAAMTALLPALSDSDERKASLALAVLTRLKDAQHGDPKIQALFAGVLGKIDELSKSSKPGDKNLAARQLEAVQSATGSTQQAAATPVKQVAPAEVAQAAAGKPRRVYLQIFDDDQHPQAEAVQTLLRDQAVPVPGIENVAAKVPRGISPPRQIRYFNPGDLGAARWTQAQLRSGGFGEFAILQTRARGGVPGGQIEIWWSNAPSPSA